MRVFLQVVFWLANLPVHVVRKCMDDAGRLSDEDRQDLTTY
jgi:hypothetical protein